MRIPTARLEPGTVVLTTEPDGDDFGIPLVGVGKPAARTTPPTRVVRATCRCQGGTVVWFTDGTKTAPLHGRTAWIEWGTMYTTAEGSDPR